MQAIPAASGWMWIKQGFALFRKQPLEMCSLFFSYFFLALALNFVPLVGPILPMLLVPVFSLAFLQACSDIESGKRVYPTALLTGFRSPAFSKLLGLGMLYCLAVMLALRASSLADDGTFWQLMTGQIKLDEKLAKDGQLLLPMLVSGLAYIPAAMAFWFAAPLLSWRSMNLGKAIFFSFFAVCKAGKAFLIYILSWFGLVITMSFGASIFGLLIQNDTLAMLLLFPASMLLTVVMYCSFYPPFQQIFGSPDNNGTAQAV